METAIAAPSDKPPKPPKPIAVVNSKPSFITFSLTEWQDYQLRLAEWAKQKGDK